MKTETVLDGIDFGEGPRWHGGRLWFSDFHQLVVRAVATDGSVEEIVKVAGRPSGLGWLPDGRLLVVSMSDRKLLRLEAGGLVEHADLSRIATGPCNDMVVSASGHAYVGNFGGDLFGGADPKPAKLALVHPEGRVEVAAEDLHFPNGSVITPDGGTLVVGETRGARYSAFDIGEDGRLGNRRVWAEVPGRRPDGCCLDEAGGIWFADASAPECVRIEQGGRITDRIEAGQPCFACMLGGEDGRTLYVLTAPSYLPDEVAGRGLGRLEAARVTHPHAGFP
jgi:sugar lactone lactonase YvrE